MARKKVKRYDDGGEIVVTGKRENQVDMDTLDRLMRNRGGGGSSGGAPSARFVEAPIPSPSDSIWFGKTYSPAGKVYGPRYSGDGFSVSGGYNPKSKVVGGRYEDEGFSAGLGYDPRRNYVGGDVSFSFKKGGKVKKMAKGGSVSSASKRADGIATKGKTKGRMV